MLARGSPACSGVSLGAEHPLYYDAERLERDAKDVELRLVDSQIGHSGRGSVTGEHARVMDRVIDAVNPHR